MVMVMDAIPQKGKALGAAHIKSTTITSSLAAQSHEPYCQEGRSLKASGQHRNYKCTKEIQ